MRRDAFQAIADPTRREIIHLIAGRSMNVKALADNFKISRPAVSLQIKILQECGLISITQQGRERFVQAQLGPLKEVNTWLQKYKEMWDGRFSRLDNVLDEMDNAEAP